MYVSYPYSSVSSLTRTYEDRMPTPLGIFISQAVYDNRLKSVHKLESLSCTSFVDVAMGKEEKFGSSWKVSLRSTSSFLSLVLNISVYGIELIRDQLHRKSGSSLLPRKRLLYHYAV
jgi:hypothetical protein